MPLPVPLATTPAGEPQIIPHICHAVSRIANFPIPWGVCLPQALAAHAWLVCHGRHVLGHRAGLAYKPIFEFPPQGAV